MGLYNKLYLLGKLDPLEDKKRTDEEAARVSYFSKLKAARIKHAHPLMRRHLR